MKIYPDRSVLDKEYLGKKIRNTLQKVATAIVFVIVYFFFIKLLFL